MLEKYSKTGESRGGTCSRARWGAGCDLKFVPPSCYVAASPNFEKEVCACLFGDDQGRVLVVGGTAEEKSGGRLRLPSAQCLSGRTCLLTGVHQALLPVSHSSSLCEGGWAEAGCLICVAIWSSLLMWWRLQLQNQTLCSPRINEAWRISTSCLRHATELRKGVLYCAFCLTMLKGKAL